MKPSAEKARLPPMIPYADVIHNQQQADQREFRKYLVDSGAVKALVKMYQHAIKHEMRVDNPRLAAEFMSNLGAFTPEDRESEGLAEETERLAENYKAMSSQATQLMEQVKELTALRLWQGLTADAFWSSRGVNPDTFEADGMSGEQVYERLCGNTPDPAADGQVVVNLLRPPNVTEAAMPRRIHRTTFRSWMENEVSEELPDWCRADLVQRFMESPADAPFEFDICADMRASELYPSNMKEVAKKVALAPPGLVTFLEALSARFGGQLEKVALARSFRLVEPSKAPKLPASAEEFTKEITLRAGVRKAQVVSVDPIRQMATLVNGVEMAVHPRDVEALVNLLSAANGKIVIAECKAVKL